jgi:tetratricopeptide (TPR) repeat protein
MAVKLPDYPKELDEGSWKSSKGAVPEGLGVGKHLKELKAQFVSIPLKPFSDLDEAIKNKDKVEECYQALDSQTTGKIEKYKKLATDYDKFCKAKGPELKNKKETKTAGEWLIKSGPAAIKHAAAVEKLEDDLLQKAESIPPDQLSSFKRELTHWDVKKVLLTNLGFKPQIMEVPEHEACMVIEGTAAKVMQENAVLFQMFYDAGWKECLAMAPTLKSALDGIDKKLAGGQYTVAQFPQAMKDIDAAFKKFDTDLQVKVIAAVNRVWEDYCKLHVEYRNYKIKAALSVTAKGASIAAGIAVAAAGGYTGVGTIMGVISMVKTTIQLVQELYNLAIEADTQKKKIDKAIDEIKKAHAKDSPNLTGSKEVAKAALERLSGYRSTSVPNIEKDVGQFENKVKGLVDRSVLAGSKVNPMLDEIGAVHQKVKNAKESFKNHAKVSAVLGKLDVKLTSMRQAATDKLLNKITKLMGMHEACKGSVASYKATVVALKAEVPTWSKHLQNYAVPFLDFASVSDIPGAVATTANLVVELAATATETTNEIEAANNARSILGNVTDVVKAFTAK